MGALSMSEKKQVMIKLNTYFVVLVTEFLIPLGIFETLGHVRQQQKGTLEDISVFLFVLRLPRFRRFAFPPA